MTSAFRAAFERGTAGLEALSVGICATCPVCQSNHGMSPAAFYSAVQAGKIESEPGFSWSSCDLCGSGLGGDREPYHWIDGGKLRHGDGACVDCIVYIANGDEPEEWEGAR